MDCQPSTWTSTTWRVALREFGNWTRSWAGSLSSRRTWPTSSLLGASLPWTFGFSQRQRGLMLTSPNAPNHSPGMDTERALPAAAAMSGQSKLLESSSAQPVLKITEDLSLLNQSSKPSRIEKPSLPPSTNLLGYSAPDYLAEKGARPGGTWLGTAPPW